MMREFIIGMLLIAIMLPAYLAFREPIYLTTGVTDDSEITKVYNLISNTTLTIVNQTTESEKTVRTEGDFIDVISGGFKLGKTTLTLLLIPFKFITNFSDILTSSFAILLGTGNENLAGILAAVTYALVIAFLIFAFLRAILGRTP